MYALRFFLHGIEHLVGLMKFQNLVKQEFSSHHNLVVSYLLQFLPGINLHVGQFVVIAYSAASI